MHTMKEFRTSVAYGKLDMGLTSNTEYVVRFRENRSQ